MGKVLTLPKCVERIDRGEKVLLFNSKMPAWLVTNANGAMLLSLCDGTNSTDDIVDAYVAVAGIEEEPAVRRFLQLAEESGIFSEPEPDDHPPMKVRQRLSLVQLSISSHCNLNCRYCYAADRDDSKHRPLQLADYVTLVNDVLTLNPSVAFSITGGEPLLNPDCLRIADYIRSKGCDADLLTNGILINEGNIEKIARTFTRVTISLDGSERATHEFFRGKGSYDKTMQAIELLKNHEVEYMLSMTVNRRNISEVEDMARKYGGRLNFQPLFPVGNARKEDDLSITGIEYYQALKEASGVKPLGYCEAMLDEALCARRYKCAIGGAELSISATGDVYPCQLLHYPQFWMGNVHDMPLSEIVRSSAVADRCAGMTVDHISGCSSCFLRYVCGGACRARAFHECGDIMTSGSFCEYEKEALIDGILGIYSENAV